MKHNSKENTFDKFPLSSLSPRMIFTLNVESGAFYGNIDYLSFSLIPQICREKAATLYAAVDVFRN